jgi:hypothetical protein
MKNEPTRGAPGVSPARRLFFWGLQDTCPGTEHGPRYKLVGDFKGGVIAESGGGKAIRTPLVALSDRAVAGEQRV